jgi:glycosyltransferase involved in cell wall biosynthesis
MNINKKILIVPHNIPYPLDQGGNIAQYAILIELQKFMDITLVLAIYHESQIQLVTQLGSRLNKVKIVVIDLTIKNSQTKRLFLRKKVKSLIKNIWQNINRTRGKDIIPMVQNQIDEFDNPERLQPIQLKSKEFIKSLSKTLEENNFDIIQIEFFEYLDLISLLPQTSTTIFVHHEIRHERLIKSSRINNQNEAYKNYIISTVKSIEITLLSKYDCIITFSENDKSLLNSLLQNLIVSIPFPVIQEEFNFKQVETKIDKIIFVGSDGHYPNRDGFEWFMNEVYDEIWNIYQLPFYIIGNWSKESITKYVHDGRIIFTGFVEDLSTYYRNSISIIPVRIGSGIRAKVLYAMANKSPVISSANGIEGIDVQDGIHFLKAENKNDYVIAIKKLIENVSLFKSLTDEAFKYVVKNYHPKEIINKRLELYSLIAKAK